MKIEDFFRFNETPNPRIIRELLRLSNEAMMFGKEPGMAMFLQMVAVMYQQGKLAETMMAGMDEAMKENPGIRKMFESAVEAAEFAEKKNKVEDEIIDKEGLIIH